MSDIMVSVFCLTYNHALYIRDALEGFLRQETTFKYNVFIFDDASTDGTSKILKDYEIRYPEIFKVYVSPVNTYNLPERGAILSDLYDKNLKGKYIAWCEGDDYWIDPNKLQIQIDYMEKHPECSMTAHASLWLDCKKHQEKEYFPYNTSRYLTAEEVIAQYNGNLSTASLVMRREVFLTDVNYPACDVVDWPLQLYAIYKGKIYFFNRVMSVYRYMCPGSWSANIAGNFEKSMLHNYGMVRFLEKYDNFTDKRFHEVLRRKGLDYLYSNVFSFLFMECGEYRNECNLLDANTKGIYKKYITKQCEILDILKEEYILQEHERKKILNFKYIVIMGLGEYAKHMKNVLMRSKVRYDGHLVTRIDDDKKTNEKFWELKNYPYNKNETMVIIGIHQKSEIQVLESLKDYGFDNVITPMWFDWEFI